MKNPVTSASFPARCASAVKRDGSTVGQRATFTRTPDAYKTPLFHVRSRLVEVGPRLDIRKRVPRGRIQDMRPLLASAATGLQAACSYIDNHMDTVVVAVVVAGAVWSLYGC